MIKPFLLSAALTAPVVLATACLDTPVEREKEDLHYELVTFDGRSVPAVIQESSDARLEILSGTFVLTPSGTCWSETRWQRTEGAETTTGDLEITCTWTWTGTGSSLSFQWNHDAESSGMTEGSLLSVTLPTGLQCVTEPCPTEWSATYQFVPM